MKTSLAAIIPAFNEAKLIGGVLEILRQVDDLDEIIVVDDGSKDATPEVVSRLAERDRRLRLICQPQNKGKGQAVFTGWHATDSAILLLLDADLVNLAPQHIRDLIEPVRSSRADMTLGLFRGGHWDTDLAHLLTPWLTGQRCLRAELLRAVSARAAAGYGLETAITVAARQQDWRCQKVFLQGVSHPTNEEDKGLLGGLWNRMKMYLAIGAAWFLAGGPGETFRRQHRGKFSAKGKASSHKEQASN